MIDLVDLEYTKIAFLSAIRWKDSAVILGHSTQMRLVRLVRFFIRPTS